MSHNTEGLNASNGGEISASCLDLLMIKIQTARRNLMTVINNSDAPIRKPLRLLHQKLGRALKKTWLGESRVKERMNLYQPNRFCKELPKLIFPGYWQSVIELDLHSVASQASIGSADFATM